MNLTDCLKKYDIDPDDVSRIRALQKDFLADGMSPEQAAVNAVETVIGEAEAERNELIDRVLSEGGDIEEYFQTGRVDYIDVGNGLKVEVIQNPTSKDYADIAKEVREEFPGIRPGEPKTRFTYDSAGNRYIWKAHQAVHASIEPELSKLIGRPVSQNQYFQGAAQTETPEFKKWFGDSKVVDENGQPLVVYHGSATSGITVFDPDKAGTIQKSDWGKGIYFARTRFLSDMYRIDALKATDKDVNRLYNEFELKAKELGTSIMMMTIDLGYGTDKYNELKKYEQKWRNRLKAIDKATSGEVYAAYVSLKNPKYYTPVSGMTEPDLADRAKSQGHDGLIITYADGTGIDEVVAFKPTQIKSATGNRGTFSPESANILEQQNLGKIQFPPDITEAPSIITLLENANETTFLHESAHFFFQILRHAASQPNANPEDVADLEALNKWFHSQNKNWDGVVRAEQHELVARAFEKYLMTGKAPSLDLQGYFRRFKAWMVRVYRELTGIDRAGGFKVKLTPGVKAVFDRMLATEEQIKEAEIANRYEPLFETAEEMGAERWRSYMNTDQEATEEAKEELTARSLQDMKWLSNAKAREVRKLQLEAAELRKSVRAEVEADLYDEPIYKARRFLTHGEVTERAKVILGAKGVHRLSIPDLKQMYGEDEIWKRLPVGKYGMVGKEGLNPDEVAEVFGLKSGDALVRGLIEAPAPKQEIERRTDDEMLKRYGDLTDPAALEQAAQEAIHNKARMRMVSTELAALSKMVKGSDYRVLDKAARAFASDAIDRRKVRDILPGRYRASASKAALAARKAKDKGDIEQAAQDKRAQLLQMHFYRAAVKGRKESEKLVRYLRKFQRGRKNIPSDYLDQIDALLNRFELRRISEKEDKRRKSLAQWVADKEANGEDVIIDETLLDESRKINHRDLTLGELRELAGAVQNIEHLGRLKNRFLNASQKRSLEKLASELRKVLIENVHRNPVTRGEAVDKIEEVGDALREFAAEHRKLASYLREFDGGEDGGIWWEAIGMPALEAANKAVAMNMVAIDRLNEIFSDIKLRIWAGGTKAIRTTIPGTNIQLTDEQRIMVGVYQGEMGNRQRLRDGGIASKGRRTQAEVDAVLDTLTKEEWDLVQDILDFVGSYKEEISALEKRLSGVQPEWLDAAPIETKYGTYRGGYFPAKYDRNLSEQAEINEARGDIRQMMKAAYHAASTRDTFVQKRADEVKDRPLRLNFDNIFSHVAEVIHRLSYEEWVKDTNKIIRAVSDDIRTYAGKEVLSQFHSSVDDVASGDIQQRDLAARILNHLRMGSTIVGLGLRFTTALIQWAGLFQSAYRIGFKSLNHGLWEFIKDPSGSADKVNSMSPMMENRSKTFMREIAEAASQVREGKKLGVMKASFFWMIAKMQKSVDIPTWLGAYDKALADLGYERARSEEQRNEIDHRARLMADQAVKDSQSHGQLIDLAKVQRGSAFKKIWTVFYSYFSATYNLNVENYRKTHFNNPKEFGEFIGNFLVLNTLPILFSTLMYEMLKPECDGDPKCIAKKFAAEHIRYMLGMMKYTRELQGIGDAIVGGHVYDYRGPAGMSFFSEAINFTKQSAQLEMDAAWGKSAARLAGIGLHLPMGQVTNTLEGITAVERGEVEGLSVIGALLAGPPR